MTPADAGERLPFSVERARAARLPGGKRAAARERRGGHGGGTRGKRPFGSLLRKERRRGIKEEEGLAAKAVLISRTQSWFSKTEILEIQKKQAK